MQNQLRSIMQENSINHQLVEIGKKGKPVTTSLLMAEKFNKEHYNVLRDIKKLECSDEFNALNFELVYYTDAKGEKRPMYLITRDGFVILGMGFTGKKAMEWKEKYIAAFNRMEQAIHDDRIDLAVETLDDAESAGIRKGLALSRAAADIRIELHTTASIIRFRILGLNQKQAGAAFGVSRDKVQRMEKILGAAGLNIRPARTNRLQKEIMDNLDQILIDASFNLSIQSSIINQQSTIPKGGA